MKINNYIVSCCKCSACMFPSLYGIKRWEDGNGSTMNCPMCEYTHIIVEGVVCDYRAHMQASNPTWTGKNYGWASVAA